jgi:hypothetical protein
MTLLSRVRRSYASCLEDHGERAKLSGAMIHSPSDDVERGGIVSTNLYVVDADQLRELSGKRNASAIRKWASSQGFRVLNGRAMDAINAALCVKPTHEDAYYPETVLDWNFSGMASKQFGIPYQRPVQRIRQPGEVA